MDNKFEKSMQEIRQLLKASPNAKKHFNKRNNIFSTIRLVVVDKGIEESVGELLWKYLIRLHTYWIQASFEQRKDQVYQYDERNYLHHMITDHCTNNGFDKDTTTHLLCLHAAIWHSLLNQLNVYCRRMVYINSGYEKFKNYFNPRVEICPKCKTTPPTPKIYYIPDTKQVIGPYGDVINYANSEEEFFKLYPNGLVTLGGFTYRNKDGKFV